MEIAYRQATVADTQELVRLRLAYLEADFGSVSDEQRCALMDRLPPYLEQHLNNDLYSMVAQREDRLVGTCWLLVVEKPMSIAFMRGRTGAIFNVYVEPACRKRGIARTLMLQLIDLARELELDRLELRATAMGHALYQSIGFCDDESSHTAMNYVLGG